MKTQKQLIKKYNLLESQIKKKFLQELKGKLLIEKNDNENLSFDILGNGIDINQIDFLYKKRIELLEYTINIINKEINKALNNITKTTKEINKKNEKWNKHLKILKKECLGDLISLKELEFKIIKSSTLEKKLKEEKEIFKKGYGDFNSLIMSTQLMKISFSLILELLKYIQDKEEYKEYFYNKYIKENSKNTFRLETFNLILDEDTKKNQIKKLAKKELRRIINKFYNINIKQGKITYIENI